MIGVPFSGSKRYSYKRVAQIVKDNGYESVFEPFGGSCILSVNLYRDGLVGRAVANDYDGYFDLYPEYLVLKEKVVEEGYRRGLKRTIRTGRPKRKTCVVEADESLTQVKSQTMCKEDREILQDIISEIVPEGFWRYFIFSGNFSHSSVSSHEKIKLKDFTIFGNDLTTKRGWEYYEALGEIELEHCDYKEFIDKHLYEIDKKSLLILDPPYVNTYQKQYKGSFTEEQTIELLDIIKSLGCDFIFFNHDEDLVRKWLEGMDYDLCLTGSGVQSANRDRLDVMAFVRGSYD